MKHNDGGKGSDKRPLLVSKEQFSENWDRIYPNKKTPKVDFFNIKYFEDINLNGTGLEYNSITGILKDTITGIPFGKYVYKGEIDYFNYMEINAIQFCKALNCHQEYDDENNTIYFVFNKTNTHSNLPIAYAKSYPTDTGNKISFSDIALERNYYEK